MGVKISAMDPIAALTQGDVIPVVRDTVGEDTNYKFDLGQYFDDATIRILPLLADLKAAPVTQQINFFGGKTFFWTLGDYTGLTDDVYIVKADAYPLTTGAWVAGTFPQLAASAGSSLVGFIRSEAHAIASTLQAKAREIVSVADWGVQTNLTAYTVGETQKIQKALDEAPIGSTLLFPKGVYYTDATLVQSRFVSIAFEKGAVVSGVLSDATKNVWEVVIAEGLLNAGDVRQLRFDNMHVGLAVGFTAKHTFHMANAAPMVGNLGALFLNCAFDALPAQAGVAVHIEGSVTQAHTFLNCQVQNQLWLDRCSDGVTFLGGIVFGTKTGFLLDMNAGAFRTRIRDNLIVCRDGAIMIRDGSQVDILGNQLEQGTGTNASAFTALLSINATQQPARQIRIIGNNFGGGPDVNKNIYIGTNAATFNNGVININLNVDDTLIDENTFGAPSSGTNIVIADARCVGTRIGPNNFLRGAFGTFSYSSYPNATANTLDPADLFDASITDSGTGTYGKWKDGTTLGLANSWVADSGFRYRKELNDDVRFEVSLSGGTLTANTTMGTFPVGFRPLNTIYPLMAAGGGTAIVTIAPTGVLRTVNATTGPYYFDCVRFRAKGRASYDPGY